MSGPHTLAYLNTSLIASGTASPQTACDCPMPRRSSDLLRVGALPAAHPLESHGFSSRPIASILSPLQSPSAADPAKELSSLRLFASSLRECFFGTPMNQIGSGHASTVATGGRSPLGRLARPSEREHGNVHIRRIP